MAETPLTTCQSPYYESPFRIFPVSGQLAGKLLIILIILFTLVIVLPGAYSKGHSRLSTLAPSYAELLHVTLVHEKIPIISQ